MTTFKQEEYESFLLEGKKVVTDVKVTTETLNHPDMMTPKELENATAVFRSLETGLRGGTIDPEDLHKAMKRLGDIIVFSLCIIIILRLSGLNPSDQDMVDIPNRIGKNGLIYFPDFCQLVLDQIREDEKNGEEDFRRNMFKVIISNYIFRSCHGAIYNNL